MVKLLLRDAWLPLLFIAAGLCLIGADVWAATTSDGATAKALSIGLYCDARNLITGNVGLILGLILVFMGIWSLVTGGGWAGAIITIIIGATVPSIPGLVEGFMLGLGTLLEESGAMSDKGGNKFEKILAEIKCTDNKSSPKSSEEPQIFKQSYLGSGM